MCLWSVLLLWFILIVNFAVWSSVGKEVSHWLFACTVFILVPSRLWVSLSRLVFRALCAIRFHRFLIIAFLSTSGQDVELDCIFFLSTY